MRRPALVLTVTAIVVLLGSAACGDDEPSDEEARAEVCDESDELRSDLQAVTDVNLRDVSVSDVEDAVDVVVNDVDELADAAREVAGAAMDDLQTAVDGLESAVGDLDGDGSVEARARAVVEAGQGVGTAVGGLTDDAGC